MLTTYLKKKSLKLTSYGNSTIENTSANWGDAPVTSMNIATPDKTMLYRRALFSFKLAINGWPYQQKEWLTTHKIYFWNIPKYITHRIKNIKMHG